jgi:hypothetical protein
MFFFSPIICLLPSGPNPQLSLNIYSFPTHVVERLQQFVGSRDWAWVEEIVLEEQMFVGDIDFPYLGLVYDLRKDLGLEWELQTWEPQTSTTTQIAAGTSERSEDPLLGIVRTIASDPARRSKRELVDRHSARVFPLSPAS